MFHNDKDAGFEPLTFLSSQRTFLPGKSEGAYSEVQTRQEQTLVMVPPLGWAGPRCSAPASPLRLQSEQQHRLVNKTTGKLLALRLLCLEENGVERGWGGGEARKGLGVD